MAASINPFDRVLADEIAQGRWPELAPLLVTLIEEAPDERILARERELILREEDRRKRADLLACALRILDWRFGKVPIELREQLGRLTAAQLEPLVGEALKTPDLETFKATVRGVLLVSSPEPEKKSPEDEDSSEEKGVE